MNHATVFQGKCTVVAWAVKELTLVLDFVLHGARKVSAAPFEGDEFAVLLPETNGDGALASIERIRAKLSDATEGLKIPVTYSIGIASFSTPPVSVDDMIGKADSAMYEIKNNGKNGVALKSY